MTTFSLDALSGPDDLVDIAAHDAAPFTLDLRPLARDGHTNRRLDLLTVATLTNLLLGAVADAPVKVHLPTAPGILTQLRRGGLFFALAQRPGGVAVDGDPGHPLLHGWRGNWRPSRGEQLFPDGGPEEVSERLYLYANTHFLGEGFFRAYRPGAAMPWLADLIPIPADPDGQRLRHEFVLSAGDALVEVAENQPSHAFKLRGPVADDRLEPWERRTRSFLLCGLTKGGGEESWNRLRVVVLDNGHGIGRTLRWQHPELTEPTGDLVTSVLRRQFRERGIAGHNGRGLWFLSGLVRLAGGQVTALTENDAHAGRTGISVTFSSPDASDGGTAWSVPQDVPLPVRGTVLLIDLVVPRATGAEGRAAEEDLRALREHATVIS